MPSLSLLSAIRILGNWTDGHRYVGTRYDISCLFAVYSRK